MCRITSYFILFWSKHRGAVHLQLQLDALEKAGCEKNKIFIDKASGIKAERPGLEKCLGELKSGDTLIVWRFDRLGCSIHHLILLVEELKQNYSDGQSLSNYYRPYLTCTGKRAFTIHKLKLAY